MSYNFLDGGILSSLFNCSRLLDLSLFSNHLGQGLPSELGSLTKLVNLDLGKNNLKGKLPVSLGNLTSLRELSFLENNLEGEIPDAIARLTQMVVFALYTNHFSGVFPPAIYNLSSLQYLSMFGNSFTGNLRSHFGNLLPSLRGLYIGNNSLTGTIPSTLANISTLQVLELNSLTGSIPPNFAKQQDLQVLSLNHNSLGNFSAGDLEFLVDLTNSTQLQVVDVAFNRLGGELPASIANLSMNFNILLLRNNFISGSIPHDIGNLIGLQAFWLSQNLLKGPIPASFGKISGMVGFGVHTNRMSGEIPYSLGNITRLETLQLFNNNFEGIIPPSLGKCSYLLDLSIENNKFNGITPTEILQISTLVSVNMSNNLLTGSLPGDVGRLENLGLPSELGSLTKLVNLDLGKNNLKGKLPVSLGNLTSLRELSFLENNLEGEIPDAIARLTQMVVFALYTNHFSGVFPPAIYNLSSLQYLSMFGNSFTGNLRSHFGNLLPSLRGLYIGNNSLTGTIPSTLANISTLQVLELNSLTGSIPPNFAKQQDLQVLSLNHNSLGNFSAGDLEFLVDLTNSTQLQVVDVAFNRLGGELPASIANLSMNFNILLLRNNFISGSIPHDIGNLIGLQAFWLSQNLLKGPIPASFGKISGMVGFGVHTNRMSGEIPYSLGNITRLETLQLSNNNFEGIIPPSLGKCSYLLDLSIENNKFNGIIPKEILQISTLVSLNMSNNLLTGSLPGDVGRLENLDISGLVGIKEVDFSSNNLSGRIPEYLTNFSLLEYLNLSFNNFERNVPTEGKFKNFTIVSVFGNQNPCGGVLELRLQPCSTQPAGNSRKKLVIGNNEATPSILGFFHEMISYVDLRNATDGFSSSNLIGSGSFGTVFKAFLPAENKVVAVKVLNIQRRGAMRSFMVESESLKNIRHRNLVKLLTACSSIDFQGNEFRALIYEYMPNGSLDMWLHPKEMEKISRPSRTLTLLERINIEIDVASVFWNDDLTAHVSDFGLARILLKFDQETFSNQLSSAGVRGSIGYAAPEYAMGGEISVHGDAYSFGILILEMFSGKRPTDEMFGGDFTLRSCIRSSLPEQVLDVADESVLHDGLRIGFPVAECLTKVLELGLGCSEESPANRLGMSEEAKDECRVSNLILGIGNFYP
uniref:Protein kinase domain-containing protein n=1 Tax=Brassica oleracea var. oleracea TaxID=109376 RepID=A0A0D3B2N4_BRAOL